MEYRQHRLDNGLEILAECNPQAYTAAFGFFVRTGSRDETAAIGGVSHFLEHMVPVTLVPAKKVRSTIRSCYLSFKRRWSSC